MPAMLFQAGQHSIAPKGAPTEHVAPLCRSGPCPRCSWNTHRRASRPEALLQRLRNAVRDPHGVPERVVAHAFHPPCPDGIRDQVTRRSPHVTFPTQQALVIRPCPERTGTPRISVIGARCGGLDPVHDRRKMIAVANLDQPMSVVRHQHPRQQPRFAVDVRVEMAARGPASGCEFLEEGLAPNGGRSHQVHMTWEMEAMAPERRMTCMRENGTGHASQLAGLRSTCTSGIAAPNRQRPEGDMPRCSSRPESKASRPRALLQSTSLCGSGPCPRYVTSPATNPGSRRSPARHAGAHRRHDRPSCRRSRRSAATPLRAARRSRAIPAARRQGG